MESVKGAKFLRLRGGTERMDEMVSDDGISACKRKFKPKKKENQIFFHLFLRILSQ